MPEEILIIIIVSILAGTFSSVVKTIARLRSKRYEQPTVASSGGGASLTTSELKRLMQEAVGEANEQVMARFDQLEDRIDALEGPAALPERSALLDAEPEETTPRRTRVSSRRS